jgi:hypothetical protein
MAIAVHQGRISRDEFNGLRQRFALTRQRALVIHIS